ncbi:MAG TPA: hypothetical protein PLA88_10200, partial [Bacteroidales bacterium]|nr:hypothetical protein [Bacteroidales bacterium]
MKKFIMMAVLAVSIVTGKAQNLLTNGDFDHEDIRHELRTNWVADTCDVSLFTEDYTWNKCLKLKVNKIIDENQVRKVYALMLFGADGKLAGFSVKPNTVYQVSLELRGTVPGVSLKAALWNKDVESIWEEVEFTGVEPAANVQVTSKWTRIQGSFKTAANTKRAALGISLWGDSSQQSVFNWKTEQYLLVDNVTAKEKKNIEQNEPLMNLSEMQAKKIITLPAQQIGEFNTYGKNQAAIAKTFFSISRAANALHLEIDCYSNDTIRASVRDNGTKIWHDDVVEIFFGPGPQKDRLLSQFAVSAGGGRFMGNGVNELLDYGKWQAKSTIND